MFTALFAHEVADSILLRHEGKSITRGQFVRAVEGFAPLLKDTRYIVNLCQNRYHFLLVFVAACLRGKTNLLPASQATGAISALASDFSDPQLMDDRHVTEWLVGGPDTMLGEIRWPKIDDDHVAAIAFTSGSTGTPQGHACTWAMLNGSAKRSAARIFTRPNLTIIATVPPQHMFGLETTILQPLSSRCAVQTDRPFFPAEIFSALRNAGTPCALITTPAHLKTCVAATTQVPEVEFVLSATAPLSAELATEVESAWHTTVLEIYGSTETGAIATRRTSEKAAWHLMPGGALTETSCGIEYRADNAKQSVLLQDTLLLQGSTHFELAARNQDLIKVAGKRASLTELNSRLLAIPGVVDGVIFQPRADDRVAGLVVVNNLTERQIHAALGVHIDPVFLPRPLRIVKALPRDSVGKLPRAQLLAALEQP